MASWQHLRTDLVAECQKFFLSKTGNMDVLRERLVGNWLSRATDAEIETMAGDAPSKATQAMSSVTSENAASSSKPESHPEPGPTPTKSATQSTASSAQPGASAGAPTEKEQSVLGQCQMVSTAVEDKSSFFTDLGKGLQIAKHETSKKTADIIQDADVVLPVAAMVKILHALSDDASNVAFLLGGWGFTQTDSNTCEICQYGLYIFIYIYVCVCARARRPFNVDGGHMT